VAPLFNYILTNSEDRHFEAAVFDTEPVVCLSQHNLSLISTVRLLLLLRPSVVMHEYCEDLQQRSEKPYQVEETAYGWTDRQLVCE
jgi:hypothetical protein